ncbi:metallophosphoesterase [Candidatus Poribacteria bacterium]|nr:metallophosphoesterase [Candidatus Poribacteria bacterium]
MTKGEFYFAQLTDIHVGEGLNPKEAAWNLRWALEELEMLSPKPELILATGDLVCAGKASELREFAELVKDSSIPILALPTNHDLWGEPDESAWTEIIGPLRQSTEVKGLRFLIWNDIQRQPEGGWKAELREEQREWFEEELEGAEGKPVIVAQHCPPLPVGGDYHDQWRGSNADELLELLSRYNVLAMITGHWHRNGEWNAKGVRVINTGALCGWQWTGIPPHRCFPTRPGYRLFHFDGKRTLRSFWRDGSFWETPAPKVQVSLVHVGEAHTGGPRPQVRPIEVFAKTMLRVTAYARGGKITKVEWSIERSRWRPMRITFEGLWSEWEGSIDPLEERALGEHILIVRAEDMDGNRAYDAIPIRLAERECTPMVPASAQSGREMVFELFYPPE